MKYVVAIPKSVLLVATILTLALFTSIYPITVPWKPVFASPDTAEDYVDIQSDVDSVIDKGTHSNFENQKATDSTYDTLTEANTNTTKVNDSTNFVDGQSDVDSHADHGTHSSFAAMQAGPDLINDTLTEALTSGGTSNVFTDGFEDGTFTKWTDGGTTTWGDGGTFMATNSSPGAPWVTHSGTYMADMDANDDGSLTSDNIDCLDASAIGVSFWYMVDDMDASPATDLVLYYYDGTAYDSIANLGGAAVEDQWYQYSETVTDSQYFISTFRIRLYGTPGNGEAAFCDDVVINKTIPNNYELDLEFQWTTADFDETNEYLCIYTGTVNAEALKVDVWTGSWTNIITSLSVSQWNNVSIGTYLTGATITFRFLGETETGDTSQSAWQIDCAIIHVWSVGVNYELELEEQFTDCDYTRTFEELCIYMGAMNGETLSVQWWNSTSNSWLTIIASLSSNQWNNVSVVDYLTSVTFTIRFVDGTKTNDLSQGTWQKDSCLLHTWTLGYNLNLRVMDLDLTDHIQGAYVYKDSDIKTSDADGWANWTEVSGTVQIKVQYFGFWVNGTFSVTMDSDKTINVQCKLYDVTVLVQEDVQNAYLASANVTVYNSTSVQDNKITSGTTGNNGQVQLLNLPNNTLTFTQYGGASYSLVIGNTTQLVSSENQTITLTANQNNINTNNNYSIIAFAGMTIPLKGAFAKRRLKKKRNRDMECEKKRAHKTSGKSHN